MSLIIKNARIVDRIIDEFSDVYIEEGKRYPFKKIRVVHGTPYSLSEYKGQIKDKKLLNELTTELMDKIYSLGDKIDAK